MATGSKSHGRENRGKTAKPLPSVATSCLSRSMVRRGIGSSPSEALQKRRTSALSVQIDLLQAERAVSMEPFMELSSSNDLAVHVLTDAKPRPPERVS